MKVKGKRKGAWERAGQPERGKNMGKEGCDGNKEKGTEQQRIEKIDSTEGGGRILAKSHGAGESRSLAPGAWIMDPQNSGQHYDEPGD